MKMLEIMGKLSEDLYIWGIREPIIIVDEALHERIFTELSERLTYRQLDPKDPITLHLTHNQFTFFRERADVLTGSDSGNQIKYISSVGAIVKQDHATWEWEQRLRELEKRVLAIEQIKHLG